MHLDASVNTIGVFLFGPRKSSSVLSSVRNSGLPLVDDWRCLKDMVIYTYVTFKSQNGSVHFADVFGLL